MRPHGRAEVNANNPRALGVCDRCGFLYNLNALRWQFDWRGPKLQNLRFLVCQPCYDEAQPNGQRTIILPPDPVPVANARPEFYVPDDNPLSALGANPSPLLYTYSNQIGTMTFAGGVPAAFDGTANKPAFMSATIATALTSFANYVGINWTGNQNPSLPASLKSPVLTHTLSSYTITAPNDVRINSTGYVVQGSDVGLTWGSWTTLASGDITGTPGEVLSGTPSDQGRFMMHRVAFYGGSGSISVAQVSLSVSDGSSV